MRCAIVTGTVCMPNTQIFNIPGGALIMLVRATDRPQISGIIDHKFGGS
jgi:hypothetical protein